MPFLLSEWTYVVDARQIDSWDAYCDVPRLGRKARAGGKQREGLWAIFSQVRAGLAERKQVTWADVFGRVMKMPIARGKRPFDFAFVDEAQDLGVAVRLGWGGSVDGRAGGRYLRLPRHD